jgi:AsmA protein
MKPLKIAASVAIPAVCLAVLTVSEIPVPFLADVIKARAEADTGRVMRIDGLTKLRLLPTPTLAIGDLTLLDDSGSERLRVETVRVTLSFDGLLSGRPNLTEIAIVRPVLRAPLLRQRKATAHSPSRLAGSAPRKAIPVGRIVIEDGTIAFQDRQNGSDLHLDRINLTVSLDPEEGRGSAAGSFRWGGYLFRTELKADDLRNWQDGQAMPVAMILASPELLQANVSATAELRLRNETLFLNAVTGLCGQTGFNGWASVDFSAGKPMVKGDVDFDRLQIFATPAGPRTGAPAATAWSTQTINMDGLNFFDADFQASASEFGVGPIRFAPIAMSASLAGGRVTARITKAETHGGQVAGTITMDVSRATPAHVMRLQISRVGVLPLLTELADFSWLEGEMEAALDVNAVGASQLAIISTLAGTVDTRVVNGAVLGVDIRKLIRDVSENVLTGWQQSAGAKTELAWLGARWVVANGVATTDDLKLEGPIVRVAGQGRVNLPDRSLRFKVQPQIVTGLGGAAVSGGPIPLGISVAIEGPWNEPRIYPDVAGILDDPDSAFSRLRAAGGQFFGAGPRQGRGDALDRLIQGFGDMFNIPLNDQKPPAGGRR